MSQPAPASEILEAIKSELAAQPECYAFEVSSRRRDGSYVILGLRRLSKNAPPLDESFEGSQAWWPGPPENPDKGAAEVLVVNLDADEIVLAGATGGGPNLGSKIFLYPPRFLDSLLAVWQDGTWATRVNYQLAMALQTTAAGEGAADLQRFPWLRVGQAEAGRLPRWLASFLWGPPGTGKTTTLGALVATLLLDRPSCRILMLSTTNSAIDQALVAVDKCLEEVGADAEAARHDCKRIGTQFIAHHYENRKHLLPQRDEQLIKQLIHHNRNRPTQGNVVAMAKWKEADDELRQRLREENRKVLLSCRLAVMTTTRASFDIEMLSALPAFDLLVVDEASQVSLAHGLAMMPLARAVLFAGDPMQLSPVCQASTTMAKKWIGRSPFAIRDKLRAADATCFLAEQSRMTPGICDLVSGLFYEGKLQVCPKSAADSKWQDFRKVPYAPKDGPVMVVPVAEEGGFRPTLDGYARQESAEKIAQVVEGLYRAKVSKEEIQVLTPYRAQRRLIRRILNAKNFDVPVTTVHRAQGSERKVIIFDPVQGAGKFMNCEEGFRLINVAFSRAQAKLIVLISQGDTGNPKLAPLRQGPAGDPLFCLLSGQVALPHGLHGVRFAYLGASYRCTGSRNDSVHLHDSTGTLRKFSLDLMLQRCGNPKSCPLGCRPDSNPNARCI